MNRSRLARTADLLGHIRAIAFLPEDLDLVKRGPAHRRDLLDDIAVQLAPTAYLDQAEYERALRQRNAFLKQGGDDDVTLSVWDERLAQAGGKVMARRARAAAALAPAMARSYHQVAEATPDVGFEYFSAWGGSLDPTVPATTHSVALAAALAASRRIDRERRMTTTGPHRDEPTFELDGHDLRYHGSQGEQRTAALAIRLATHGAVAEQVGVAPLLLLDDVFSELDPDRAAALADALPHTQTMITSADRGDVPVDGKMWRVGEGTLT